MIELQRLSAMLVNFIVFFPQRLANSLGKTSVERVIGSIE